MTEEEAYIALYQGDEQGLNFFFNRYYSPLVFYSTSITGQHETGKEVAAAAFMKLWSKKGEIEEWRKVRFLLYKIVHNASVDFLRENKRSKRHIADLRLISNSLERSTMDALIETETYGRLYHLLQKLPPRSRQIFQMFYFQKKAIKEIAAELNISVNTVKTQKLRAIQFLKEYKDVLYMVILFPLFFF